MTVATYTATKERLDAEANSKCTPSSLWSWFIPSRMKNAARVTQKTASGWSYYLEHGDFAEESPFNFCSLNVNWINCMSRTNLNDLSRYDSNTPPNLATLAEEIFRTMYGQEPPYQE